jgi:membrane fusion protein, multidrug efflux system
MAHPDIAGSHCARDGGLLQTDLSALHYAGRSFTSKAQKFCANVAGAALIFAIGSGVAGCKKKEAAAAAVPDVEVITLQPRDVPIYEDWIGTLDGYVNAQIRAQVSGYLLTQNYKEGGAVKKGDVLFEIDPRPFQATLEQARATLAQDQARAVKAQLDVKRYTPLAKTQAISEEELDNAVQAGLAAEAQVKADEAAVDLAKVNLDFTKISSPIDGIAGLATAQIGDLVGPTVSALTTVSTVDPIKVYFAVTEQSYLKFWRQFIASKPDGAQETPLELELMLGDGTVYPEKGKFFFADRQVNITAGTMQVAGLFPNADHLLRPGQYARVRARTRVWQGAMVVPQRAVSELQGSYQVTVVENANGTNTAHLRTVTAGDRIGSDWIIASGLKAGEQVVVEGNLKAKDGKAVNPRPFTPPAPGAGTVLGENTR